MTRCPGLSFAILFIHLYRVSSQVTVDQSPLSLRRSAGQDSSLSCNYSGAMRNVQWYRQAPGESPAFLVILYKDENATVGLKLRAELRAKERRSSLHIRDAQLRDAATYFCAVETQGHRGLSSLCKNRGRCQVGVYQDPSGVSLEGERCRISCREEVVVLSRLQWFGQPQGQSPAFLLMLCQNENTAQGGGFTAQLLSDKTDSYFWAVETAGHRAGPMQCKNAAAWLYSLVLFINQGACKHSNCFSIASPECHPSCCMACVEMLWPVLCKRPGEMIIMVLKSIFVRECWEKLPIWLNFPVIMRKTFTVVATPYRKINDHNLLQAALRVT